MRTSTKDEAARVRPARIMSLEGDAGVRAAGRAGGDLPELLRLRKRLLKEGQRRRCARLGADAVLR